MLHPNIEIIEDNGGGLTIQDTETKKVCFFANRFSESALDSLRALVQGEDISGWEHSDPRYFISGEDYGLHEVSRGYKLWEEVDVLRHLLDNLAPEREPVQKAADDESNKGSRTKLATVRTFDPQNICSTGYTFTLYGDGHVSAEYRSRWQGSVSGTRYVTDAGYVDLSGMDSSDIDNDAEALLTSAVSNICVEYDSDWRQTRKGHIVR